MSRSAVTCRCGRTLGHQRPSGNVAVLADVHVEARLREGRALLRCPACGAERPTRAGVVVRWGEATRSPDILKAS